MFHLVFISVNKTEVHRMEKNMRTEQELLDQIVAVVPSKQQLEWQKLEFTAFFHYGINSFTNREWGEGTEDIGQFDPKALDTDQWCESLIKAGIRACILTCKHHDGFCLWDTAYTTHSVMHTPYQKDILKSLEQSCKKYGIRLGVYLSPWDRHEATYGQGVPYDDYFCNQLTELLTNYGELYTVWFDGACGEGPNGKKQVYDWDRYYALIRKLQPNAVISVSGPDVRWCGNEAGDCRESEWSVVPKQVFSNKAIAQASQQADTEEFRLRKLGEMDQDLGSRDLLRKADSYIWYPAEVDTSIRPGWFYHEEEDNQVRPLEELFRIYVNSVGGNGVLLLNIPPHKDGYVTKFDVERLTQLGDKIKASFGTRLDQNAIVTANDCMEGHEPECVQREDDSFWKTREDAFEQPMISVRMEAKQTISYIVLQEAIQHSQRVESFVIEAKCKDGFETVYEGTTIGYKKICAVDPLVTDEIRITITSCRKNVMIQTISIY